MSRIFCLATASFLLLASNHLVADQIPWSPSLDAAQQIAQAENKLLLIHFSASWCPPCRKVEENVFPSPRVTQTIRDHFVALKVDADQQAELCRRFGVERLPTDVILTANGTTVHRMTTPQVADDYARQLSAIAVTKSPQSTLASRWGGEGPRAKMPGVERQPSSGQRVHQFTGSRESVPLKPAEDAGSYASRYAAPSMTPNPRARVSSTTPQGAVTDSHLSLGPRVNQSAQAAANEIVNPYAIAESDPLPAGAKLTQEVAAIGRSPVVNEPTASPVHDVGPIMPDASELPLGLDGRCPVTLVTKRIWQKGDRRFGAIHRGYVYIFAGEQEQRKFLSAPDDYSPVLAGMDIVRLTEGRSVVAGDRRFGVLYDADGPGPEPSRIYLFDSAESRNRFESPGWPEENLQPVLQAMQQGTLGTYLR